MASSSQIVYKLYKSVIEDVINNVREAFLDEGVEEPVLQDLKQIWEGKLLQSRAVDLNPPKPHQTGGKYAKQDVSDQYQSTRHSSADRQQNKQSGVQQSREPQGAVAPRPPVSSSLSSSAAAASLALQQNMLQLQSQPHIQSVPFTIQHQGSGTGTSQTFPAYQIQTQQQQQSNVVGYQCIPLHIQPNAQQPQVVTTPQGVVLPPGTIRVQSSGDQPSIVQVDGANDTSDEEEDDFDDDDDDDKDDDDDNDDNENEDAAGGDEAEPLNSADDVSDEDPSDLFEADNVIVCQYEKINRSRNKWKFNLKHGIMNLRGKDYVFCKSNGDADW